MCVAKRHRSRRREEDGRGARVHRNRFAQSVFPGMRDHVNRGATVGTAMADQRAGHCGVVGAVWPGESHRGRSVEPDLGVCRSPRRAGRGGAGGRHAEDADQSGLCGQDRPAGCAPPRGRVASRQCRRDLLSARGDSRPARIGPLPLSFSSPASEPEAADPCPPPATGRRR